MWLKKNVGLVELVWIKKNNETTTKTDTKYFYLILYPAKVTNGEKTTYNFYMVKKDKTFLENYQSNKLPK